RTGGGRECRRVGVGSGASHRRGVPRGHHAHGRRHRACGGWARGADGTGTRAVAVRPDAARGDPRRGRHRGAAPPAECGGECVTASVEQLRTGLDGLARAWWRVRWLHRLARAAAAIAVLLAIWAAVDWWRPLGRAGLLTWGGLAACALVGGIGWLVWLWRRRPAPARMALLVEERCPGVDAPVSVALDPTTLASPL